MKTTITIENGKITVQVDDQLPAVVVKQTPILPDIVYSNSKPTVEPATPKVLDYLPTAKDCEVCGTSFKPPRYDSRFCSKKCATKFYNKAHRDKVKSAKPEKKPPEDDSVMYCKHCKAYTTHYSADHPSPGVVSPTPAPLTEEPAFLPGFEKSDEELESWKPREFPTPTPVPNVNKGFPTDSAKVEAMMDEQRADFDDPWNCGMCRNAGALCLMHEKMTADGKVPPKI